MKRKRAKIKRFEGDCFAVEIGQEYKSGSIDIRVSVEDDGNWFTSLRFSHFWLPEIHELLGQAIRELGSKKLKISLPKEK